MGRAFFTVIAAIAQLERELIVERVRNGLKAARARGKHIGREKKRDSELIRKLLKAGLTYRNVAAIAKCSHGSVWAEKQSMMKDAVEQKRLKAEQQKVIDDALKSGTYFNNGRPANTEPPLLERGPVIEVSSREVIDLEAKPPKISNTSPDVDTGATAEAA